MWNIPQALDVKHLGPYHGGVYTVGNKSVKLELTSLKNVVPGVNLEKAVFGKVVCWIQDSDCVPLWVLSKYFRQKAYEEFFKTIFICFVYYKLYI